MRFTHCFIVFLAMFSPLNVTAALVLHPIKDYPLLGKATRWDYMSMDPTSSQIFIAHLGDNSVVVFNTKTT